MERNIYYDFNADNILQICFPSTSLNFTNDEIEYYSKKLAHFINGKKITLFLTIESKTIIERKQSISSMVYNNFGLHSNTLFEHRIKNFDGVIRICALDIHTTANRFLLNVLINYSFYSFAVIGNVISTKDAKRIIHLMEDGMLTPKVLRKCSNAVLSNRCMLLHVLQGFDGYSINLLSEMKTEEEDAGTVCVNPNEKLR